jgi:acyl-CoA thioesterase-1
MVVCLIACGSRGEASTQPSEVAAPAREPAHQLAEQSPPAAAPSAAAPSKDVAEPAVAFLGDSIAAGLHLPAGEAFPAILERRLRAQGHGFRLINAGVSGDTTAGGLRRVDWILKQHPAVVVIELGSNDGLRGVKLELIEHNLRAIADKVRAAGARPLLLGVRLPPSYGADYTSAFDAIYPRLAAELALPFVPYFMQGVAGVATQNLQDGLHPTPQGHARLADNVAPVLRETLQQLGEHGPP